MKRTLRITRKTLSLLLTLAMLVTAMPLAPIPAAAAEAATYTDLASALAAIDGDPNEAMTKTHTAGNGSYDSTQRQSGNATFGAYADYWADSNNATGSWVVGKGGQALWEAAAFYRDEAAAVFNNGTKTDYVCAGMPTSHNPNSATNSSYGTANPLGATYRIQEQANYTSPQIMRTLAEDAAYADYADILAALSGEFSEGPTSGAGNGTYNLLSIPYCASASNHLLYGTNKGRWSWGWRKSQGGFIALRAPLDAIVRGSNSLDAFGATADYDTARLVYYMHEVNTSSPWVYDTGFAQPAYQYQAFWHRLAGAPILQTGTDIGTDLPNGIPVGVLTNDQKTVTLDTALLKQWRDATPTVDLTTKSYGQLLIMLNAYTAARDAMIGYDFPTAAGNGSKLNMFTAANAGILEHFGLRDIDWGDEYEEQIIDRMNALKTEAPEFFFHSGNGKYVTGDTFIFRSAVSDSFDPRPGPYGGYSSWQTMAAFYAQAGLLRHAAGPDRHPGGVDGHCGYVSGRQPGDGRPERPDGLDVQPAEGDIPVEVLRQARRDQDTPCRLRGLPRGRQRQPGPEGSGRPLRRQYLRLPDAAGARVVRGAVRRLRLPAADPRRGLRRDREQCVRQQSRRDGQLRGEAARAPRPAAG